MKFYNANSLSSDSKGKSPSSNDRMNTSETPSPALPAKVYPLPSPRFPKPGEIWRGKDLDGMTEYEILILEVGPNSVQYAFAWEDSDTLHRYSCSLSIFLALYSRQWKEPQPCSPLSSSVSKISWLKQARSFFASVIPWVKRNVSRLNPF